MLDCTSQDRPGPVLVIEDDLEILEEIRREFLSKGHNVEVADTVSDGLKAARTLAPPSSSSIACCTARTGCRS